MEIKELTKKLESKLVDKTKEDYISLELQGHIDIFKKSKGGRRIIAGYASVAVVDSEEQLIPIETLQKGIDTLLKDPHYSNLMLIHKNIQIGKIIKSFGRYKTHVDNTGLFIVAEIRNDIKTADQIWESIINEELNGFSIGCEVLLSHDQCDDNKCITILDQINIFEVSVCSQPVNETSGFIIVSKSSLCDTPKNVCKKCDNMSDNMNKEKTKAEDTEPEVVEESEETETTEDEPSTEEKSTEDRITDIERQITTIKGMLEELAKPPEEDEEEYPEEEEEDMKKKSEETEPEPETEPKEEKSEPEPEPEKTEEKSEEEIKDKSEFEDLKSQLKAINEKFEELNKFEELRTELKAKDDMISSLEKKVKTLSKSKEKPGDDKPKTIQKTSEETEKLENDFVFDRGSFYRK